MTAVSPSSLRKRLSHDQMLVVMHVANGKTISEIAAAMHYSERNISHHLAQARKRAHANNLPHLVSIAIAAGDLVWEPAQECRQISTE